MSSNGEIVYSNDYYPALFMKGPISVVKRADGRL